VAIIQCENVVFRKGTYAFWYSRDVSGVDSELSESRVKWKVIRPILKRSSDSWINDSEVFEGGIKNVVIYPCEGYKGRLNIETLFEIANVTTSSHKAAIQNNWVG
jgi:hypothetical protein